jgi:hypothetical protein
VWAAAAIVHPSIEMKRLRESIGTGDR